MAQEKARASRARTKEDGESGAAAEQKAGKATPAKKPPAKKAPVRKVRTLASVPVPTAETIAERAYLLWERGEPGDQMDHWLRAEAELKAA
jgi:hypothetical protein